jgi:hypothetical protein
MGLLDIFLPGNPVSPWLDQNRNKLTGAFGGLVGHGNDPRAIMSGAVSGMQQGQPVDQQVQMIAAEEAKQQAAIEAEQAQQQQTIQWLQQQGFEDLAEYARAGNGGEAWKLALERMNPETAGGDESFFGTPIWGTGPDGAPAIGQLSDQGGITPVQVPEGFSFGKDPIRIDAGDRTILLDPVTRSPIGEIPHSGAPSANMNATIAPDGTRSMAPAPGSPQAAEVAAARGKLENQLVSSGQTVQIIDQMIGNAETGIPPHPGLSEEFDAIFGIYPPQWAPVMPQTDRADFRALLEQASGKAFLEAYAMLKGGGPITDIEGTKAGNAMARMQTAQTKEAFVSAMKEFREAIIAGMQKLQAAGGQLSQLPPPSSGTTASGISFSVTP